MTALGLMMSTSKSKTCAAGLNGNLRRHMPSGLPVPNSGQTAALLTEASTQTPVTRAVRPHPKRRTPQNHNQGDSPVNKTPSHGNRDQGDYIEVIPGKSKHTTTNNTTTSSSTTCSTSTAVMMKSKVMKQASPCVPISTEDMTYFDRSKINYNQNQQKSVTSRQCQQKQQATTSQCKIKCRSVKSDYVPEVHSHKCSEKNPSLKSQKQMVMDNIPVNHCDAKQIQHDKGWINSGLSDRVNQLRKGYQMSTHSPKCQSVHGYGEKDNSTKRLNHVNNVTDLSTPSQPGEKAPIVHSKQLRGERAEISGRKNVVHQVPLVGQCKLNSNKSKVQLNSREVKKTVLDNKCGKECKHGCPVTPDSNVAAITMPGSPHSVYSKHSAITNSPITRVNESRCEKTRQVNSHVKYSHIVQTSPLPGQTAISPSQMYSHYYHHHHYHEGKDRNDNNVTTDKNKHLQINHKQTVTSCQKISSGIPTQRMKNKASPRRSKDNDELHKCEKRMEPSKIHDEKNLRLSDKESLSVPSERNFQKSDKKSLTKQNDKSKPPLYSRLSKLSKRSGTTKQSNHGNESLSLQVYDTTCNNALQSVQPKLAVIKRSPRPVRGNYSKTDNNEEALLSRTADNNTPSVYSNRRVAGSVSQSIKLCRPPLSTSCVAEGNTRRKVPVTISGTEAAGKHHNDAMVAIDVPRPGQHLHKPPRAADSHDLNNPKLKSFNTPRSGAHNESVAKASRGEGVTPHPTPVPDSQYTPYLQRKLPIPDKYNALLSLAQYTKHSHTNAATNATGLHQSLLPRTSTVKKTQLPEKTQEAEITDGHHQQDGNVVPNFLRKRSLSGRVSTRLIELFQSFRAGKTPPPHLAQMASGRLSQLGVDAGNSQTFTLTGPENTKKIQITFSPKDGKRDFFSTYSYSSSSSSDHSDSCDDGHYRMRSVIMSPVSSDAHPNVADTASSSHLEGYYTPKQRHCDIDDVHKDITCRRALDESLSSAQYTDTTGQAQVTTMSDCSNTDRTMSDRHTDKDTSNAATVLNTNDSILTSSMTSASSTISSSKSSLSPSPRYVRPHGCDLKTFKVSHKSPHSDAHNKSAKLEESELTSRSKKGNYHDDNYTHNNDKYSEQENFSSVNDTSVLVKCERKEFYDYNDNNLLTYSSTEKDELADKDVLFNQEAGDKDVHVVKSAQFNSREDTGRNSSQAEITAFSQPDGQEIDNEVSVPPANFVRRPGTPGRQTVEWREAFKISFDEYDMNDRDESGLSSCGSHSGGTKIVAREATVRSECTHSTRGKTASPTPVTWDNCHRNLTDEATSTSYSTCQSNVDYYEPSSLGMSHINVSVSDKTNFASSSSSVKLDKSESQLSSAMCAHNNDNNNNNSSSSSMAERDHILCSTRSDISATGKCETSPHKQPQQQQHNDSHMSDKSRDMPNTSHTEVCANPNTGSAETTRQEHNTLNENMSGAAKKKEGESQEVLVIRKENDCESSSPRVQRRRLGARNRYSYRAAVLSDNIPESVDDLIKSQRQSYTKAVHSGQILDTHKESITKTKSQVNNLDKSTSVSGNEGQSKRSTGEPRGKSEDATRQIPRNGNQTVRKQSHPGQDVSGQAGRKNRFHGRGAYKALNSRMPQTASSMTSASSYGYMGGHERAAARKPKPENPADLIVSNDKIHNVHINDKICIIDMDGKDGSVSSKNNNNNNNEKNTGVVTRSSRRVMVTHHTSNTRRVTRSNVESKPQQGPSARTIKSETKSESVSSAEQNKSQQQKANVTRGQPQNMRSVSTPSLKLTSTTPSKLPKYKTTSMLSKTAVIRRTSSVVKTTTKKSLHESMETEGTLTSVSEKEDDTKSENISGVTPTNINIEGDCQQNKTDTQKLSAQSGLDDSVHVVDFEECIESVEETIEESGDGVEQFKHAKHVIQQVSSSSSIKPVSTLGKTLYKPYTGANRTPFLNIEGGPQSAMSRLFGDRKSPRNPINPTLHTKHSTNQGGRFLGQRSRSLTEHLLQKQLLLVSQDTSPLMDDKKKVDEESVEMKDKNQNNSEDKCIADDWSADNEVRNLTDVAVNDNIHDPLTDQSVRRRSSLPSSLSSSSIKGSLYTDGPESGYGNHQNDLCPFELLDQQSVNTQTDEAYQEGMTPWPTTPPTSGARHYSKQTDTQVDMDTSNRGAIAYKLWKQVSPSSSENRLGADGGRTHTNRLRPKSADFSLEASQHQAALSRQHRARPPHQRTQSMETERKDGSLSPLSILESEPPPSPNSSSARIFQHIFGGKQLSKDRRRPVDYAGGVDDSLSGDSHNQSQSGNVESLPIYNEHNMPEKIVRIKRYNSISKYDDMHSQSEQGPPLARFSSNEDIDSCPTSPVRSSPTATRRTFMPTDVQTQNSRQQQGSSPHSLEQQLSKLLMQVSTKGDVVKTDTVDSSSEHNMKSPPTAQSTRRTRRFYGTARHQSLPVPKVTMMEVCEDGTPTYHHSHSVTISHSGDSLSDIDNRAQRTPGFVGSASSSSLAQSDSSTSMSSETESVMSSNRLLPQSAPMMTANNKTRDRDENVVLRQSPTKMRERPKSDCLTVRWQGSIDQKRSNQNRRGLRARPKSDLGDAKAISEALQKYELKESSDRLTELGAGVLLSHICNKPRSRRMSTPHPIKMRIERTPPVKQRLQKKTSLNRTKSAPELDKVTCNRCHAVTLPVSAGDLEIRKDILSDEESVAEDTLSLDSCSVSSRTPFDENTTATFAEALWDHVTMDDEELAFSAHDVIEVTDMTDKDWWWGVKDEYNGWFPAAFVRLRANQGETAEDFVEKMKEGTLDTSLAIKRHNTSFVSKDQARTNVLNEIIHAEREYVRHLKDVVQGYVEKARKRPEMFSEERILTIFGNIEEIFSFSEKFLAELESYMLQENIHISEIGQCFVSQSKGFEIYSEYCNNHPQACKELKSLLKDTKYQQFFEACRLLQQMIEIPLEGFLLIPVQKICKYPLQLAELLKYTRKQHPDCEPVRDALHAMKEIAVLINERKRKMESVEKLALWQMTVTDWEGPDLLEKSSELIFAGVLNKINPSGWSQERNFFLFDHQLVYCKKDMLWRDALLYKGRIDLDNCHIEPVKDGKDGQLNVTVKHAWKIHDGVKEKTYLLCAKSANQKSRWLKAFSDERNRVNEDKKNGFNLNPNHRLLRLSGPRHRAHPNRHRGKGASQSPLDLAAFQAVSPHATLPRNHSNKDAVSRQTKKKSWFPFGGKKSKT